MSELAFESATKLAGRIQSKDISSRELLEYFLKRVDQYNDDVNALVVQVRDRARARADAADDALAAGNDW